MLFFERSRGIEHSLAFHWPFTRHNKRWRTHLFHDHHNVSKRKWETQSRCPERSAYCISDPIDWMLISAICMGALSYHSYHSIHVSSIFRAAAAETLTRHRLQWCNEEQWASNILHYPDQVTYGPESSQWDPTAGSEWKKKWPWMLFKGVITREFARLEMQETPVPRCDLGPLPGKCPPVGAERPPPLLSPFRVT